MKEALFRHHLELQRAVAKNHENGWVNNVTNIALDTSELSIGQVAIWKRVQIDDDDIAHFCGCELCQNEFESIIRDVIATINQYLSNRLTNPIEIAIVTYRTSDNASGCSIRYVLANNSPRIITEMSLLADGVTKFFDATPQHVDRVKDVILPDRVGEYLVQIDTKQTSVVFEQEILDSLAS